LGLGHGLGRFGCEVSGGEKVVRGERVFVELEDVVHAPLYFALLRLSDHQRVQSAIPLLSDPHHLARSHHDCARERQRVVLQEGVVLLTQV